MSLQPRKCCVPSCDNVETSTACWFYEFPSHGTMYESWIKQCAFLHKASTEFQIICSAHFDEYSFQSDGELFPDAVPTLNLPENEETGKSIDPTHLFVALFIDESGKIVNFSLVEYQTVEKWQTNDDFDYGVAEIFTNAEKSVDKKLGLLGSVFNCTKCKTGKEFGVVVMQKREVLPVPELNVPEVIEELEPVPDPDTEDMLEEVVEPKLVELPPESVKRKAPSATHPQQQSLLKKSRNQTKVSEPATKFLPTATNPFPELSSKDETIMGIKFFNERSCNKCGFMPNDEEILQSHVDACRMSQLTPSKNNIFPQKGLAKGGQRIRISYICSKCTIPIMHRDLHAHAEFHVKFAPYACKCSKCFATEEELAEHLRICGQHLFKCKTCHKEFVKKKVLFQHMSDVHGLNQHGQPIKR